MKTKPILVIAACLLLCGGMFFSRCSHTVDDADAIKGFLSLISLQVKDGQTQSLLKNFDMPQKKAIIRQLVNLLCNKSGVEKGSKPNFNLTLNMEDDELKSTGLGITLATIPVKFSRDSIADGTSKLSFRIKKGDKNRYKIVDVDATQLIKDYIEYENMVRMNTLTDKDIYSPQTLAAFKVAEALKSKYDSIPWFQHMGNQTYYFVVKGKLNLWKHAVRDSAAAYKMGLVDSAQKELIPVEFDLIHNIGATFSNLIEVEKEHKRGFYNLSGQQLLPAEYDQIFPLDDADNLAVLRKGDGYYWWKKDYTVSDKDGDIKIAELLPRIQTYGKSPKLTEAVLKNVTEYNSRENHSSVYISPSYMVDWGLLPLIQDFQNPLRKNIFYDDASEYYALKFEGKNEEESWLSSVFYSIKDNYIGGRGGLYEHKNIMLVNKKNNRVYGHEIRSYLNEMDGEGMLNGICSGNKIRVINDSLYEVKVGADIYRELYDGTYIDGGTEYHYLALKNDKLIEKQADRLFEFTRYVKMDDGYLIGCYKINGEKTISRVNPEMLRYMKNEIYASYKYEFKDKKWAELFNQNPQYEKLNATVDDSLSAIEKYNIAFINKKLQELNGKTKVLAAK